MIGDHFFMKTLAVGEFKTHFSAALEEVRHGKTVGVSFGRTGRLVAVLAPPKLVHPQGGVTLGSLKKKASFRTKPSFKISEEDLLAS
jgi:antitoxin (DNA-binding transcriptional repressor) of toxin-antitoxin stability system